MKTKIIILLGMLTGTLWLPAQVTMTNSYSGTSALIPDGNPVGLEEQFNVSGVGGAISDIQVQLGIIGGFNGDLYAYLVGPQGQLAVLLNRVGVTGSNPFGYGDEGMNITLDGLAANNIHDYGSSSYSLSGTTWAADGRNIDPQSSGAALYAAPTTANLSVFQTTDANGAWTFFIADVSAGGGTATLNSLMLTIITVPEPQTWVMSLFGGVTLLVLRHSSRRSQK